MEDLFAFFLIAFVIILNINLWHILLSIFKKVKSKYPDKSFDMIGHLLGTAVAEDLWNDPQVKNVITSNKPTTPYDLINTISNQWQTIWY